MSPRATDALDPAPNTYGTAALELAHRECPFSTNPARSALLLSPEALTGREAAQRGERALLLGAGDELGAGKRFARRY